MRRMRNAKIIATLGPATSSPEAIRALFEAGADAFRMNFSHGDQDGHKERLGIIRALEKELNRPICVMLDLQGPKLRVGEFTGGAAELETGAAFRLDLDAALGGAARAHLPHPEIFKALKPGTELLLDDGRIRLRVEDCSPEHAHTRVEVGGTLSDHKGVNVPSVLLDLSPLTEKDLADLRFGLEIGVDWVALSFVQRGADVEEAKKIIAGRAWVMSKLEKPAAVEYLDDIVKFSDGVMVARGDLGVELPPEDVPAIQKRVVRACQKAGRPVTVATQMLDSMVGAPTPTRAEVSDVATAVYDGADSVMLSAETAVGEYPAETVAMMDRIIRRVEADPLYREMIVSRRLAPEATSADAITEAARQVSETISAAAIVTFSATGSTTLRAARERPSVQLLGLTPREDTARRLVMVWGVHSRITADVSSFREMVTSALACAAEEEIAEAGDRIVITAGVPFGTPGATNILRIAVAE
ncbi:MAG: pyruvate kinase [Rhodospirillales bacterium]